MKEARQDLIDAQRDYQEELADGSDKSSIRSAREELEEAQEEYEEELEEAYDD